MSRLPQSPVDVAVPELRTVSKLAELERRLADLELLRAGNSPSIYTMTGTGDTGLLGGTFTQIPGMSISLTLEPGWLVIGDATVHMQTAGGQVTGFFGRSAAAGAGVSLYSVNEAARIGPNAPVDFRANSYAMLQAFTVASGAGGTYSFGIYCQAGGTSGYGIGSSAQSVARLLVFKR